MPQRYRVTGKFVNCKTTTTDGVRIVGLYEGAVVPADASQEWIDHHLANDLIGPIPGTADPEPEPAPEPDPPKAPARAQAAKAKGE
jgi:hypothetical protein